jgi:hypothetical protein
VKSGQAPARKKMPAEPVTPEKTMS